MTEKNNKKLYTNLAVTLVCVFAVLGWFAWSQITKSESPHATTEHQLLDSASTDGRTYNLGSVMYYVIPFFLFTMSAFFLFVMRFTKGGSKIPNWIVYVSAALGFGCAILIEKEIDRLEHLYQMDLDNFPATMIGAPALIVFFLALIIDLYSFRTKRQ